MSGVGVWLVLVGCAVASVALGFVIGIGYGVTRAVDRSTEMQAARAQDRAMASDAKVTALRDGWTLEQIMDSRKREEGKQ